MPHELGREWQKIIVTLMVPCRMALDDPSALGHASLLAF
jgi:hypothetical protein